MFQKSSPTIVLLLSLFLVILLAESPSSSQVKAAKVGGEELNFRGWSRKNSLQEDHKWGNAVRHKKITRERNRKLHYGRPSDTEGSSEVLGQSKSQAKVDPVGQTRSPSHPSKGANSITKAVASSFSNATVSGSSSSNSTNSTTLNTFTSSILSQHNTYRSKHKVGSLSWDATIAATAQTQADSCVYGHPSNLKTGQNIFAGTGTSWTSKDASDSWYNEVTSYDFSNPGFSSSTGHFTQMVWKGTTKLGCAISTSCTGSQLGFGGIGSKSSYIVCNYMSPGNVQGLFLQNVLPA